MTIFLSSPGDVAEERQRIDDVVREQGALFGKYGLQPRVWRHERSALPGVGVDAQAVVERDLPEDYEIYVGIMCRQLGTPTKRAPSGTLEEFAAARRRFLRTGKPRVLFYFCSACEPRDDELADEQLRGVLEFRAGYPGLFATYDDADELAAKFAHHLTDVLLAELAAPGGAEEPIAPAADRRWAWVLAHMLEACTGSPSYLDAGARRVWRALRQLHQAFDLDGLLDPSTHDLLVAAAYLTALRLVNGGLTYEKVRCAADLPEEVACAAWSIAEPVVKDEAGITGHDPDPCLARLHPSSSVVAALLGISDILSIERASVAATYVDRLPDEDEALECWLAALTERIAIGRNGLVTFHLRAPSADWVEPLKGATAYRLERLVQRHRRRLNLRGLALTVGPCRVALAPELEDVPASVRTRLVRLAQEVLGTLEYQPHLGAETRARADQSADTHNDAHQDPPPCPAQALLPLPDTAVLDRLALYLDGEHVHYAHRIDIRDAREALVLAREVPPGARGVVDLDIATLAPGDWHRWSVTWDDGTGLGYAPLASGTVRRLGSAERALLDTVTGPAEAVYAARVRLGLWNDLLETLWADASAPGAPTELRLLLYQLLHDALRRVEEQCPTSPRLELFRLATNWVRGLIGGTGGQAWNLHRPTGMQS
ncbi:MAG: hypothetical protein GWN84_00165 [Gammaproteobacteria bacterium]|nr:hypothetical protein [Gammaproteobacteria bacterium]NIR81619.1 hypothetical protein [Gammaproteobacteria bacterium]NIR88170.1 hypothetical protein [Gammaproteobacteria bacterium]NIU02731.1 hypothetical protein [Gammaproteobacteria bacterium]NIV73330.1 hypothetical protein [Gammaproteobacteria bacterium]